MALTIDPLGTYCLLRVLPDPEPAGLVRPVRSTISPTRRCRIEAVGPDVLDHRPGMTVVVSALVGVAVEDTLLLAEETAILADLNE